MERGEGEVLELGQARQNLLSVTRSEVRQSHLTHPVEVVDGGARREVDDELGRLVHLRLALEEPHELERLVRLAADEVCVLQAHGNTALGRLSVCCTLIFEVDYDAHGIPQPDTNEVLDGIGHRRAEQVCAPLLRQVPHDALDVATVVRRTEKPVRLVEHQYVEVADADGVHAPRREEEGGETAGRTNKNVGGLGEEGLVGILRAARHEAGERVLGRRGWGCLLAVDGGGLLRRECREEEVEDFVDLSREFTAVRAGVLVK